MSKTKSPQVKKSLSLARDRRNTYGENAKASRKNIPRRKQMSQGAARHAANAPLARIANDCTEEGLIQAELESRCALVKKRRSGFKKHADVPLGAVLDHKARMGRTSWKAMGTRAPWEKAVKQA